MYQITVNENRYEVKPNSKNSLTGTLNDEEYALDLRGNARDGYSLLVGQRSYEAYIQHVDYELKAFTIAINNTVVELQAADRFDLLLKELGMAQAMAGKLNELKAPMPGMVLSVAVQEGDAVEPGDPLVVLEAMKMENVLKCSGSAVIKKINCTVGTPVSKNDVLIEFEV